MQTDGSNVRRLTFEGEYNDGASWNPEGTRIVYASRRQNVFQIAVTDVATGETFTLTSGAGNKEKPSFSPDGRKIVYQHRLGGKTQIYSMDIDGSDARQLTSEGNNSTPSWSPYPEKYR
jgi:TolB protein